MNIANYNQSGPPNAITLPISFVLSILVFFVHVAHASITVDEIESEALLHRQTIKSALLEVSSIVTFYNNGTETQSKHVKATIYLDEGNLRSDYIRIDTKNNNLPYRESHCFTPESLFVYSEQILTDGGTLITKIERTDSLNALSRYRIPDPRLIGIVNDTFANLIHHSVNSILGNRYNLIKSEIGITDFEGTKCYKITYEKRHGKNIVTIDPSRGFNPILIESFSESGLRSLECKLQYVDEYGWFPSSVTYNQYDASGLLEKNEELEITITQVNQRVDEKEFSLAGMGVPIGTRIYDLRERIPQNLILTSTGLEPALSEYRHTEIPLDASAPVSRSTHWFLILNGIIFFAIALFVIWRKSGS